MMSEEYIFNNLMHLYEESPTVSIGKSDRFVIFSDLHLGDGSGRDDFLPNSELFQHVLKAHYLKKGYSLILNGDIEELQRFPLSKIAGRWESVYRLFDRFERRNRLFKLVGNHDFDLVSRYADHQRYPLLHSLRLDWNGESLFIFHGHQASLFLEKHNRMAGLFLRYIANPLRIRNASVSRDSRKQYLTERRVYEFASSRKILSIIGHTHRPLFESLSKIDALRFRIEQLCREYPERPVGQRQTIERNIRKYQEELRYLFEKNLKDGTRSSLYNLYHPVPCLFNSGCTIGKSGITSLEIDERKIRLVHWFNSRISRKYLRYNGYEPKQLGDSDHYRMVLNSDYLEYVFSRIRLLA